MRTSPHATRRGLAALAACIAVAATSGCKTRSYNNAAAKSSDAAGAGANTLGEDWRPPAGKTGFQGVLLSIKPRVIWQSFDVAVKITDDVLDMSGVPKLLGRNWTVRPFGTDRYEYVAWPYKPLDLDKNDVEMLLRDFKTVGKKDLVDVQAMWADVPDYGRKNYEGEKNPSNLATKGMDTSDPEWSIKYTNVPKVWDLLRSEGKGLGKGITVGVIDTGVIDHPEVWPLDFRENGFPLWFDMSRARTFRDGDEKYGLPAGRDPYQFDGRPSNPGHGTAVSGILIAPKGQKMEGLKGYSTGIAPEATILPVRVTPSTVMMDGKPMAQGITYAVEQGAKIISISIGAAPSVEVREAVRDAVSKGVIVVAAAGNGVPLVVWPAAYPEVIAVGAGTVDCKAWDKSSPGPKVEILAPGSEIWYPATFRDRKTNEIIYSIKRGQGTSFATPHVAAIAALWLSRHGWDEIVKKYGDPRYVSLAFRYLLASEEGHRNCNTWGPRLDTTKHGKGMINALGVVQARLPYKEGIDVMLMDRGPVRLPKGITAQNAVAALADAARSTATRDDDDDGIPDLLGLKREERKKLLEEFIKLVEDYRKDAASKGWGE